MPRSLYSLHPGLKMIQSSMRLLEERTGKSAKQWAAIAKRDGPAGSARG
jgi:hypothetical protein